MYKTVDGASKALEVPVKNIEGRQVHCNLAAEGAMNSGNQDKKATSAMSGTIVGDGYNRKVFFKSLDFSTSQETIRSLCSAYGEVEHIQMKIDAGGRSNGMATVTFTNAGAASDCVRLIPREVEGRRVQIQFSNPPPQQQQQQQQQQYGGQQPYTYNPYGDVANQSLAATMMNPIAALNPAMMSAAMTSLPPQQQQQIQQQYLQQQQQYQQQQQQQQHAQGLMRR